MKKKYKRIIKGVLIICLSFFLCLEVSAKECTTSYNEDAVDNNNGTITVVAGNGEFRVLKFIGAGEDIIFQSEYTLKAGKTLNINYTPNVQQDIYVVLVYSGTDECYKNGVNLMDSIKNDISYGDDGNNTEKGIYKKTYSFTINGPVVKENVQNEHYGEICRYFREGIWNDKFKDYVTKADFEKYNPKATNSETEYRGLFPYCYSSSVSTNYSTEDVAYRAGVAIRTYKFNHRNIGTTTPDIPKDSEETFEDTSNLKLSLTCDILNLGTKSTEYQYVNKHKYTAVEKTSKEYKTSKGNTYTCNKTCTEVLTVEYGPPVASIAGLCFEYKVRVTSEVTCQTTGTGTPPNPDEYKYCEPIPQCRSQSGLTTIPDAGPNEDFDNCINTCDNGKYTQKCINKCYKQVYTDNNSSLLSYTDKLEATELDSCNELLNKNYPNATDLSKLVTSTSYDKNKCYGKYTWSNGKIIWQQGKGGHWAEYARYYLSSPSKAQETINHDQLNVSYNAGKKVKNERRYYSPTSGGFKTWTFYKTDAGATGGATCDYSCSYVGCSSNDKLNPDDVTGDYEKDMGIYEQFINECTAEASCSTKTAEFTIKVNNKTKDKPNDANWINYNAATLTNTTSAVDINDESNIILNRSGCYGEKINKNNYMTEWSFPGTWVNNKTGEISYKEKEGTTWHKKTDKFCTSLNSADVNVGWWYYGAMKALGKSDDESKKNAVTGETMTDEQLKAAVTEKNIVATVAEKKTDNKDFDDLEGAFGHFHWKIEVKCFYALYDTATIPCADNDPSCPPDSDDSCIEPDCTIPDPAQRYRIRTVDTADLFPSAEGKDTTDPSKTGRTPGFNWTVNATNLKNKNYIIAPSALLTEIQEKERKGETYSDANLEYEFELDRTALSAIRKHTTSGNYTNFTGNFTIVNGVSVYNSSLFRGTGSTLDSKYVIKKGILGCNNEDNGKCYNYSSLTGE